MTTTTLGVLMFAPDGQRWKALAPTDPLSLAAVIVRGALPNSYRRC
jgi:hypothetical protein